MMTIRLLALACIVLVVADDSSGNGSSSGDAGSCTSSDGIALETMLKMSAQEMKINDMQQSMLLMRIETMQEKMNAQERNMNDMQQTMRDMMHAQERKMNDMQQTMLSIHQLVDRPEQLELMTNLKELHVIIPILKQKFNTETITELLWDSLGAVGVLIVGVVILMLRVVRQPWFEKESFVWVLPDVMSIMPTDIVGCGTYLVALGWWWSDNWWIFVLLFFGLVIVLDRKIQNRFTNDVNMESANVSFNLFNRGSEADGYSDFTFVAPGNIPFSDIGLTSQQANELSKRCTNECKLLALDETRIEQIQVLKRLTMCVVGMALQMPKLGGKTLAISLCFEPSPKGKGRPLRQFRVMVMALDQLEKCTQQLTDAEIEDDNFKPDFIDDPQRKFPSLKQRKDRYSVMYHMNMESSNEKYVSLITVPDA